MQAIRAVLGVLVATTLLEPMMAGKGTRCSGYWYNRCHVCHLADGTSNLRLACSGSHSRGIVEVFAEMQWLKVCSDSLTDFEKRLVCRELGVNNNSSTGSVILRVPTANPLHFGASLCRKTVISRR